MIGKIAENDNSTSAATGAGTRYHQASWRLRRLATLGMLASVIVVAAACGSTSSASSSSSTISNAAPLHRLLPSSIRNTGIIVNGTPETNPPFIFTTPSGQLTGLDYSLANALEKELGVSIRWTDIPFPGLQPALASHKINMSLSVYSDGPEVEDAGLNFVDYALQGETFLVKYGNPLHLTYPEGLCGKTVAATEGAAQVTELASISAVCKSKNLQPVTSAYFSAAADVLLALNSGRAQAAIHPSSPAQYIASTGKLYSILPGPYFAANYYGIAVPKSSTALAKALVQALRALVKNGQYARIFSQYSMQTSEITLNQVGIDTATAKVPLTRKQKTLYGNSSPFIYQ